jgi:hypothetical protein
MNEWHEPPDQEDLELGEPVAELRQLAEHPSPGFMTRIRNSINRRLFAAESLDFGLMAFFQTFFEYLKSLIQAFGEQGQHGGQD